MSMDHMIKSLERAVGHLELALEALNSARTWSIIDVIGLGGILGDIFEYSEFGKAKKEVELATNIIRDVESELKNMEVKVPEIDHTTMWAFLDIGFDGLIIDLLRHSKINEAKAKVEETIEAVDRLISQFKNGTS
jgi:hypothetical protein